MDASPTQRWMPARRASQSANSTSSSVAGLGLLGAALGGGAIAYTFSSQPLTARAESPASPVTAAQVRGYGVVQHHYCLTAHRLFWQCCSYKRGGCGAAQVGIFAGPAPPGCAPRCTWRPASRKTTSQPLHPVSRQVADEERYQPPKQLKGHLPSEVVLYQYQVCPFCCKVKAFLDYHKASGHCLWLTEMRLGVVGGVFERACGWSCLGCHGCWVEVHGSCEVM